MCAIPFDTTAECSNTVPCVGSQQQSSSSSGEAASIQFAEMTRDMDPSMDSLHDLDVLDVASMNVNGVLLEPTAAWLARLVELRPTLVVCSICEKRSENKGRELERRAGSVRSTSLGTLRGGLREPHPWSKVTLVGILSLNPASLPACLTTCRPAGRSVKADSVVLA